MTKSKDILHALGHAILVLIYILVVASLMTNAESLFINVPKWLIPVPALLLLTLSAAVMGLLIFGRPVYLFMEGRKKDSMLFLGYTIFFVLLITALAFIYLFFR